MGVEVLRRKFAPTSSSSEEYDPVSGACSIDFYMAAKDLYRVAPGNLIPVPWPYAIFRPSDEAAEIVDALRNDYKKVLAHYTINLQDARVLGLSPRGHPQARDILIINTHDENPLIWKLAATDIQQILDDEISRRTSGLKRKLRVEIRNHDKMYRDVSCTIKPDSLAHKACMQVEDAVYKQVTKSCPGQWRAISYHMRGPAGQICDRKPTIMVRIAPGARSLWAFVESQIIAAVESASDLSVELHVELLPGCVMPLISDEMRPSPPLIIRDLPESPVNGSSIGPWGTDEAGSLGVWVDFQPMGSTEKQRCFLTCHHVISPGDPVNKSFNDHVGIALEGRQGQKRIRVDYPAPFDAIATKKRLRWEIEQGDDGDGQNAQTINTINTLVSAGGIGSVIHASGYIRKNSRGRRMDWALVRVHRPNASESNKPPAARFSYQELWNGKIKYKVNADEVVSKVGSPAKGEWVAKVGRSGVVASQVNAMETTAHWENGAESNEIDALDPPESVDLSLPRGFAVKGDSGSMVINLKKEWVGIVIGKLSTEDHGLFTSAQEIMDDIKATTGGSISLV